MTIDERKQSLVRLSTEKNRICPQPVKWDQFWRLIGTPRSEGLSPPLILSGWAFSTDRQKREAFQSHIRYAASNGLLDEAEQFIDKLQERDWHTCPEDRLDFDYGEALAKEL